MTTIKQPYNQKEFEALFYGKSKEFGGSNLELLWAMAKHKKDIRSLNGQQEYAVIDSDKIWGCNILDSFDRKTGEADMNRFVELLEMNGATGFCSQGMAFVLKKNVPEEFIEMVAMHEIEEIKQIEVGYTTIQDMPIHGEHSKKEQESDAKFVKQYAHEKACKKELTAVFGKGQGYSERYAQWLLQNNNSLDDPSTFFNQAIPGFLNNERFHKLTPLEIVTEFYEKI